MLPAAGVDEDAAEEAEEAEAAPAEEKAADQAAGQAAERGAEPMPDVAEEARRHRESTLGPQLPSASSAATAAPAGGGRSA